MLTDKDDGFSLDLFFELSEDLLCFAGYDGYFKKINPAVSKVLGYSREELMSKPISEFIHTDDQNHTNKHRNNLRQKIPLLNFDNRYLTKTGEVVWLSWTSVPVQEKELVFAIAKNITHKRKMEQERNDLLSKLDQTNNELKQLGYTTSHDLRSPVNNLLTLLELLDSSKIADKDTLDIIDALKATSEGLKATLNLHVENLTKKEDLKLDLIETNISDCLNTVIGSINALIVDSRISIETDFTAFSLVNFKRDYLESVFLNLITNSIKYARPEHKPEVHIRSVLQNGVKQLIFSDNGLGFDMEVVKDKVFRLNQKFHNHADSKGVGLYLVYNHITSLGGKISLESNVNEGTTFYISFP